MTSFAVSRLQALKKAILKHTETTWEGWHINRQLDAAIVDIAAHEKKRTRK